MVELLEDVFFLPLTNIFVAVMKMKVNLKLYAFYSTAFLIGASISAGVFFAYRAELFPCEAVKVSEGFSLLSMIGVAAALLKPLFLIFLSAFTLYSCAISSLACIYIGSLFGRITMAYCLSGHTPFTHCASLMLTVFLGVSFVIVSKEASLCRGAMTVTAPRPAALIKSSSFKEMIRVFVSSAVSVTAISVGGYLMLLYFRL